MSRLALILAATMLFSIVAPRHAIPKADNGARPAYPFEPNLIEILFAAESSVRLRGGALVDLRTNALDGVEKVLSGIEATEWLRICDVPERTLDEMQSRGMANTGSSVYNLNNIYRLRFDDRDGAVDVWKLAADLEALPGVVLARPVPKPMALPVPPDYDPLQGYNNSASAIPVGIDARYAGTLPGGDGTGVTICDLEYGWNYGHADVTKAVGSQINTNVILSERDHGTAVIGQLVADNNGWGTKGSCYGSSLRTCGTITGEPLNPPYTWNVPGALAVAIANLSAGDIILLEQQWDYTGNNGFVPIEWWMNYYPGPQTYNGVYAAIVNAVANGIHVVEAGGNGNVDTDYMTWFGDSGAIIVGAGGAYSWNDLERLSFSSYGSRFNLQGWGQNVVTTGYGDLYNTEGPNLYYTGTFGGTSSASPIVAAAVACVQGYYLANVYPVPLPPLSMRALLMNTGTPQRGGFGSGRIGPRPNVYAAIQTIMPPREFGDAPEGAVAYLSSGVIGAFPTCVSTGPPGSFVQHANIGLCYFGDVVDAETDGNAGNCPNFPPYDADECQGDADGDAGLLMPTAMTINPLVPTPVLCQATQLGSLGNTCTQAVWGTNVDIRVTNNSPETVYVNVLADWDQDGQWGGAAMCGATAAPEHVLVNFPVPSGYTGPLSSLGPPPFLIGPSDGYVWGGLVWTRFTVSEAQVAAGWNGAGTFDQGETCDYLLRVEKADYGDAPEGAIAYPDKNMIGIFPTCVGSGSAGFVSHQSTGQLYFGPAVDLESEGNAGNCPNFPPYDADECQYTDGDAGLLFPTAYTIVSGSNDPVSCQSTPLGSLGTPCETAVWGTLIDITVTNTGSTMAYVNALVDWNQDAWWQGESICPAGTASERIVVNLGIPAGFSGPLSTLATTAFRIGPNPGYVWARFTVSDAPIPTAAQWTGEGVFEDGETEDYLLKVDPSPVGVEDGFGAIKETRFSVFVPNPFHGVTTIHYEVARASDVSVAVFDVAGRRIRVLTLGERSAGRHRVEWDGRNDAGERVATGVYFVRLSAEGKDSTRRIVLLR